MLRKKAGKYLKKANPVDFIFIPDFLAKIPCENS